MFQIHMRREGTSELTSWKEIASHLQVTVRTAQMWEKERGLPVRRVPGKRSRVSMRLDELEAWQESRTSTDPLPTPATALNRSWLVLATVAAVGIVAGISIGRAFLRIPASRFPADWHVLEDTLIVSDQTGAEAWRVSFPDGLNEADYDTTETEPIVTDLNGDGSLETLFVRRTGSSASSDTLHCFSQDGSELWHFDVGRSVETATQGFDNIYKLAVLRVFERDTGEKAIFVASHHKIDYPTQMVVLSHDGDLQSEYWHSGHVANWSLRLHIGDLDGDGQAEIYAAGVSNSRDQATVVVLDADEMAGASFENQDEFQILGFGTGNEIARVFFPRSSMNRALEEYNVASSFQLGGMTLAVGVQELASDPQHPTINYYLRADLSLVDLSFSDSFAAVHKRLRSNETLNNTLREEEESLRQQGIRVLRPSVAVAPQRKINTNWFDKLKELSTTTS